MASKLSPMEKIEARNRRARAAVRDLILKGKPFRSFDLSPAYRFMLHRMEDAGEIQYDTESATWTAKR